MMVIATRCQKHDTSRELSRLKPKNPLIELKRTLYVGNPKVNMTNMDLRVNGCSWFVHACILNQRPGF